MKPVPTGKFRITSDISVWTIAGKHERLWKLTWPDGSWVGRWYSQQLCVMWLNEYHKVSKQGE